MVLTNMVTKPPNSKVQQDMTFGQRAMIVTTPDADMKENKDYMIGDLGIAWRHRRFKVAKYSEISIRYKRASGAKTEYQKILDGECKSQLFVFEFVNAWVICSYWAILKALKEDAGYVQPNHDGITSAYYISLDNIPHLLFMKPGR
jgi:hypothetical protein